MSVHPIYDTETEGLVYHVVPTYETESISDITSESESAASGITIASQDLSEYFVIHYGRQQPANENVMRWLPTDNTRRDILRHVIEKYIFGENYLGPVKEILNSAPGLGREHQVLEIGTRGGSWVQEMASEFPHVQFTSVDIAPLVPHVPRPNIAFEVYDLSTGILFADGSVDIVFINGGREIVKDYSTLLVEVHRVLRPGGLIHIREYDPGLFDPKDYSKLARATNPQGCHAFDLVFEGARKFGADPEVCPKIQRWLSPGWERWTEYKEPRGFEKIYSVVKMMAPYPHDGYPCAARLDPRMVPLIRHYNLSCIRDGVGLLCEGGLTVEESESLIEAMIEEYKDPERCPRLKWRILYATKPGLVC